MTEIRSKIENFLKNYGDRIFETKNEVEYWRTVIAYLHEENFIENQDIEIIERFLLQEENHLFSEERVLSESEKGAFLIAILEKILAVEMAFQEKDNIDYGERHRKFIEDKKRAGINEKKYIEAYFAESRKYCVLSEMYKHKYDILKGKMDSRILYKKYGKRFGLPGEYYCYSPIMEINIGNIPPVTLLKKKPEDLCEKVEYSYDENGCLILCNEYGSEGKLYSREFLLYAGEWLMNLYYNNREDIQYITLRRYEREIILEYERICLTNSYYSVEEMCSRINKENYTYSGDGILTAAVEEEYLFPIFGRRDSIRSPGHLRRTEMSFERDKEGIIGEWRQEFTGDKARYEPGYFKLNKRERKITKKDRGRWRRPNYFVE